MKLLRHLFSLLSPALLLLTSCQSELPDAKSLTRYYQQAEQLAKHDIELLDGQLAAGQLTQQEHDQQKATLLGNVQKRAVDAAWTHHAMVEAEREAVGLPTPHAPQEIAVPTADSLPTGSGRRAFNSGDQTFGSEGNPQAVKQFFQGYKPGGNVRGNTGRAF